MSAFVNFAERPDRALFSSSGGTTVFTNVRFNNTDAPLAFVAGTYTLTVTVDGATVWSQAGVVLADTHVYGVPPITGLVPAVGGVVQIS